MTHAAVETWRVDESAFPHEGSSEEKLTFALRYAALAPSSHNTQPWQFRVKGELLELRADRCRRLPVVDPDDRALTMSCGAALFILRVALRHFGCAERTEILPDPLDRDLLGRVRLLGGGAPGTWEDEALFRAIPHRHTNRRRYELLPVPAELIGHLREAADQEGAWLYSVAGEVERDEVAAIIAEGDRAQMADPAFRHELAHWIHPNRGPEPDGIPASAVGVPDLISYVAPILIERLNMGRTHAEKDYYLAEDAPALCILGTAADEPGAWLAAGQALARILLRATVVGLSASFFNQPVEVPELRKRLAERVGLAGYPHLIFRLGYGPDVPPTPRRPLEKMIAG